MEIGASKSMNCETRCVLVVFKRFLVATIHRHIIVRVQISYCVYIAQASVWKISVFTMAPGNDNNSNSKLVNVSTNKHRINLCYNFDAPSHLQCWKLAQILYVYISIIPFNVNQ